MTSSGMSAKARGRHLLNTEVTLEDYAALKALAADEDLSLAQLVRRGIRRTLAEKSEAAPRSKGRLLEDAQAGAFHGPE
jgi:hypothetical protein